MPTNTVGNLVFATVAIAQGGEKLYQSSWLLTNAAGENNTYTGVGRLTGTATCTMFLVAPETSSDDSPAYGITNGHCIARTAANEVRPGQVTDAFTATLHYFIDTTDRQVRVRSRAVA